MDSTLFGHGAKGRNSARKNFARLNFADRAGGIGDLAFTLYLS